MCIRDSLYTFTGLCQRQEGARNRSAVHGDALHALLHGVGVLHPDVVHGTPVAAGDGVACQRVDVYKRQEKYKHRTIVPKLTKLSYFVSKHAMPIVVVFLVLLVPRCV